MSIKQKFTFREPTIEDGLAVNELIQNSPPLDTNSSYCNFLQCSHFSATCVVAEKSQQVAGFVSAYIIPERPDTIFIWQVAVSDKERGNGLASKMLNEILNKVICQSVNYIETTITDDNQASWKLFEALSRHYKTNYTKSVFLDKDSHFCGQHETEFLVHIGPIKKVRVL